MRHMHNRCWYAVLYVLHMVAISAYGDQTTIASVTTLNSNIVYLAVRNVDSASLAQANDDLQKAIKDLENKGVPRRRARYYINGYKCSMVYKKGSRERILVTYEYVISNDSTNNIAEYVKMYDAIESNNGSIINVLCRYDNALYCISLNENQTYSSLPRDNTNLVNVSWSGRRVISAKFINGENQPLEVLCVDERGREYVNIMRNGVWKRKNEPEHP
jgi:hypothetical protein